MGAERKHGINARYLVAHAMLETQFGTSAIARNKRNLFGYNAYDRDPSGSATRFKTYDQGILAVAEFIDRAYLSPTGRWWTGAPTLRGMRYYASDPKWEKGVAAHANRIKVDSLTRRGITFGIPVAPARARAGAAFNIRLPYAAHPGSVLPAGVTFEASWEPLAVVETRTAPLTLPGTITMKGLATVSSTSASRTIAVPAPPIAGRWRLAINVRDSDGAALPDDLPIRTMPIRLTTPDEVVLGLEVTAGGLGVRVMNTADASLPTTGPETLPVVTQGARPVEQVEIVPTIVDVWAMPLTGDAVPRQIAKVPLRSASRPVPRSSCRFQRRPNRPSSSSASRRRRIAPRPRRSRSRPS